MGTNVEVRRTVSSESIWELISVINMNVCAEKNFKGPEFKIMGLRVRHLGLKSSLNHLETLMINGEFLTF